MEIANKWAKGEDSVRRDRTRPRDDDLEDDARYQDDPEGKRDRRRRRRSRVFYTVDGTEMVAGGFEKRDSTQCVTGDRNTGYRTSSYRDRDHDRSGDRNNGGYRQQGRDWQPRRPQTEQPPPREQLTGPCTFHFYYDNEGKRRSTHALKIVEDSWTFRKRTLKCKKR